MILMRMAEQCDIESLYKIADSVVSAIYDNSSAVNPLALEKLLFVDKSLSAVILYCDEQPAACCLYEQKATFPECKNMFAVKFVGVMENYRLSGYGSALLLYLLQKANDEGISGIIWNFDMIPDTALPFCEKFDPVFAGMKAPSCQDHK